MTNRMRFPSGASCGPASSRPCVVLTHPSIRGQPSSFWPRSRSGPEPRACVPRDGVRISWACRPFPMGSVSGSGPLVPTLARRPRGRFGYPGAPRPCRRTVRLGARSGTAAGGGAGTAARPRPRPPPLDLWEPRRSRRAALPAGPIARRPSDQFHDDRLRLAGDRPNGPLRAGLRA